MGINFHFPSSLVEIAKINNFQFEFSSYVTQTSGMTIEIFFLLSKLSILISNVDN